MLETLGANLNDEIKSSPYYENKVQFTLQEVNKTGNQELINAVKNIGNNFSEETTFEQLGNYMDQIDVIRDSYKTSKGTTILASQVERSQMINENSETQVSNDYGVSVKTEIDDSSDIKFINPETGENFGEKIIGVTTGVIADLKDSGNAGVDAYKEKMNEYEKEQQEKLQEQITEFQEEMMKLEFSGNLSNEEFEKQLDLILKNDKFKDISDELKSDIRNNLLKLKGTKDTELKKVNDSIDSLYDPSKPNSIVYKDENLNEKVVEFNSPEEAQQFLKNLKVLAEEEFNNSWGDAIFDFFGDASEWVLPLTDIRGIFNGKFLEGDWIDFFQNLTGLLFELIGVILLAQATVRFTYNGPIESLRRRIIEDGFGRLSNNPRYTFDSSSMTNFQNSLNGLAFSDNEDLGKLTKRHQIKKYLEYKGNTITNPAEKAKFFKELRDIERKFFFNRSNTYLFKMYKLAEDGGFLFDTKIIFVQGYKIIPEKGDNFKFYNPFSWLKYRALDLEDTIMGKIFDPEFLDQSRQGADLFFKNRVEDSRGLITSMELDQDQLNKFISNLKERGFKDSEISEIEKYIRSIEKTKEPLSEINRKLTILVETKYNRPKTSELEREIKKLEDELRGKTKLEPFKKKELKNKIQILENFRGSIVDLTWIGNENEIKNIIDGVKNGTIKDNISSNFDSYLRGKQINNIDEKFTQTIIEKGEKSLKNKEAFEKFLNQAGVEEKINNYISFIHSDEVHSSGKTYEKYMEDLFEELKKLEHSDENEYFRRLEEILKLPTNTLDTDGFKNSILKDKLDEIGTSLQDVKNFYRDTLIGSNNAERLNNLFGVSERFWSDDIDNELNKFLARARTHGYSNGQATFIINEIFDSKSFDSIILNNSNDIFNLNLNHNDINYSIDLQKKISEQIKKDEAEAMKKSLTPKDINEYKKDFNSKYNEVLEEYKYSLPDDLKNELESARNKHIVEIGKGNIPDDFDKIFRDIISDYEVNNNIDLKAKNDEILKIEEDKAKIQGFINDLRNNNFDKNQIKLNFDQEVINLRGKNSEVDNLINTFENNYNNWLNTQQQNGNSSPKSGNPNSNETGKQNIDIAEKSKQINELFERLQLQLILDGTYDSKKQEFLKLQNKYLNQNNIKNADLVLLESSLKNKFNVLSIKTKKDLKLEIKAKEIIDSFGNKVDFNINFRFKDVIDKFRTGDLKVKI